MREKFEGSERHLKLLRAKWAMDANRNDEEKKAESEANIVAKLMADRSLAERYWQPDLAHMLVRSWWSDPIMYYSFMLRLQMFDQDVPTDWAKKMMEKGKALLEKEQK